ncbi:3-phosphoglycerate dehydrogenase [bacterium]|nr:3-phosphoglycerate dehydrogenase [bacterium]
MKVLLSDKYADETIKMIKDAGHEVVVKTGMTNEELIKEIPSYDVICVRSATKVTKDVIDAATNLKLIARGGVGLDNVDQAAAKARGIEVRNTPGVTTNSVAELTIALMLAVSRQIPQANASMKAGKWERKLFKGVELTGKTLGLLAMGRIGGQVAKYAQAFGMKVQAYDPYLKPEVAKEMNVELKDSIDSVLSSSDYISLHMPLTDETKNMLNAEKIAKVKKGAYIVNAARGGIVDEVALANAIKEGCIAGAALDVFESEPPANRALVDLDQVVCVPHIGAQTAEGQLRAGLEVGKLVVEFGNK